MISAVAFCPHPPVLVPAVAQGAAAELDQLRTACRAAIVRVAPTGRVVLLASGSTAAAYGSEARGTFAGFGLDLEIPLGTDAARGALELPPSLTVGAWLVRDAVGPDSGATAYTVSGDGAGRLAELEADAEAVVLIVLGDGSARRSLKAPGYLDDRAGSFDAAVVAALAGGVPEVLAALDPVVGHELLAAGVPVWRAVGALLAGTRWSAEVLHDAAPYGVEYAVAVWTRA